MRIWLRFRLWLAIKLKRDYIKVTSKQLGYLRDIDMFVISKSTIGKIYGLRVYLK